MSRPKRPASSFRYFKTSPELIRLAVMLYVKYPLSLRNVEDLLAERGIVICMSPSATGSFADARDNGGSTVRFPNFQT